MHNLSDLLSSLSERHRAALLWFIERAGKASPWPEPLQTAAGSVLLASRAKGIYKPEWSRYALSIRLSLDSPYPDREPVHRRDKTRVLAYYQENGDESVRDDKYTNRALLECLRDRVPVGVLRQTRKSPGSRYRVLGVALVAGWDGGYFFFEGFSPDGLAHGPGPAAETDLLTLQEEQAAEEAGVFDPRSVMDERERIIGQIVRRRGQPRFRRRLLEAYRGCCSISGCTVAEALDAAHIARYMGPATDHVSNGLLLRADLHTLFDLGLVAFDPKTCRVLIAPALCGTSYGVYAGKAMRLPLDPNEWPRVEALEAHREWSGL